MLDHPRQPRITDATKANSATVQAMPRSAEPNQHFGWLCVDAKLSRLVVAFRGTEYFKGWLDDFDFAPAPYSAIPGRGTVHQGFQIVYEAVRDNLRKLVQFKAANCKELLITGHSLGGALAALSAPDQRRRSESGAHRLYLGRAARRPSRFRPFLGYPRQPLLSHCQSLGRCASPAAGARSVRTRRLALAHR
jgi:hypothetical protein